MPDGECKVHEGDECDSCNQYYYLPNEETGQPCKPTECVCELGTPAWNGDQDAEKAAWEALGNPETEKCRENGEDQCRECRDPHLMLVTPQGICVQEVCECMNGQPKVGTECHVNGTNSCASCDKYYHIGEIGDRYENKDGGYDTSDGDDCVKNRCVCQYGDPDENCNDDGANECSECYTHHRNDTILFKNVTLFNLTFGPLDFDVEYFTLLNYTDSDGERKYCQPKNCTCTNGTPTASKPNGGYCSVQGGEMCDSCDTGYHLSHWLGVCLPNVCTCDGGEPRHSGKTADLCSKNGEHECQECYDGWYSDPLDNLKCKDRQCICLVTESSDHAWYDRDLNNYDYMSIDDHSSLIYSVDTSNVQRGSNNGRCKEANKRTMPVKVYSEEKGYWTVEDIEDYYGCDNCGVYSDFGISDSEKTQIDNLEDLFGEWYANLSPSHHYYAEFAKWISVDPTQDTDDPYYQTCRLNACFCFDGQEKADFACPEHWRPTDFATIDTWKNQSIEDIMGLGVSIGNYNHTTLADANGTKIIEGTQLFENWKTLFDRFENRCLLKFYFSSVENEVEYKITDLEYDVKEFRNIFLPPKGMTTDEVKDTLESKDTIEEQIELLETFGILKTENKTTVEVTRNAEEIKKKIEAQLLLNSKNWGDRFEELLIDLKFIKGESNLLVTENLQSLRLLDSKNRTREDARKELSDLRNVKKEIESITDNDCNKGHFCDKCYRPGAVLDENLHCKNKYCPCDHGTGMSDGSCNEKDWGYDNCYSCDFGYKLSTYADDKQISYDNYDAFGERVGQSNYAAHQCVPNECYCTNKLYQDGKLKGGIAADQGIDYRTMAGAPVNDGNCIEEGEQQCGECKEGYTRVKERTEVIEDPVTGNSLEIDIYDCQPNHCTCNNGKGRITDILPATGAVCLSDGSPSCGACNQYYNLQQVNGTEISEHKYECVPNVCLCDDTTNPSWGYGEERAEGFCQEHLAQDCVENSCLHVPHNLNRLNYTRYVNDYDKYSNHIYHHVSVDPWRNKNDTVSGPEFDKALGLVHHPCAPKQCSCENGTPVADGRCYQEGKNLCSACNRGYHLDLVHHEDVGTSVDHEFDDQRCVPNVCVCKDENGKPIGEPRENCDVDGANECQSCADPGSHISEDWQCVQNECLCRNGIAYTGVDCEDHNSTDCQTAAQYYHRVQYISSESRWNYGDGSLGPYGYTWKNEPDYFKHLIQVAREDNPDMYVYAFLRQQDTAIDEYLDVEMDFIEYQYVNEYEWTSSSKFSKFPQNFWVPYDYITTMYKIKDDSSDYTEFDPLAHGIDVSVAYDYYTKDKNPDAAIDVYKNFGRERYWYDETDDTTTEYYDYKYYSYYIREGGSSNSSEATARYPIYPNWYAHKLIPESFIRFTYKYNTTANVCTCKNGTAIEVECPEHGANKCKKCDYGFFLNEDGQCVINACKCGFEIEGEFIKAGEPARNCSKHYDADKIMECEPETCYFPGFRQETAIRDDTNITQCQPNSCTCANRVGQAGNDCEDNGTEDCRVCIGNYHIETRTLETSQWLNNEDEEKQAWAIKNICVPNRCTCPNGLRVDDEYCTVDGEAQCLECDQSTLTEPGYHLEAYQPYRYSGNSSIKFCAVNECRCDYGEPRIACSLHNDYQCENCSPPGRTHNDQTWQCDVNECTCQNGVAHVANNCEDDDSEDCDYCIGNYHLETYHDYSSRWANSTFDHYASKTTCEPNVCVCANGEPVDNADCTEHGANECKTCDSCTEFSAGYHLSGVTKNNVTIFNCEINVCHCIVAGQELGSPREFCCQHENYECEAPCYYLGNTHNGYFNSSDDYSFTCDFNDCNCENGSPYGGDDCEDDDSVDCQSCNRFYHLHFDWMSNSRWTNTSNHAKSGKFNCRPNECYCNYGESVENEVCEENGNEQCEFCDQCTNTTNGYHLVNATESYHLGTVEICVENQCYCSEGTPSEICCNHGSEYCADCDSPGKRPVNGICTPNVCECANGVAFDGDDCTVHGATHCSVCDETYHPQVYTFFEFSDYRNTTIDHDFVKCKPNGCTCDDNLPGIPVNSSLCLNNNLENCASCESPYAYLYAYDSTTPLYSGASGVSGFTCLPKVCDCDNGSGDDVTCLDPTIKRCKSCDPGYELVDFECLPVCDCEHGVAVNPRICIGTGVEQCEYCNANYTLGTYEYVMQTIGQIPGLHIINGIRNLNTCSANECTCDNGVGLKDGLCWQDGGEDCDYCDPYYTKYWDFNNDGTQRHTCEPNTCICDIGVPVPDEFCRINLETQCQSCHDFGYFVDPDQGDRCMPKECACENGKGIHDGTCMDVRMNRCRACDEGYTLKFVEGENTEFHKLLTGSDIDTVDYPAETCVHDPKCSCPNGIAADDCNVHNDIKCAICNEGFYLDHNDKLWGVYYNLVFNYNYLIKTEFFFHKLSLLLAASPSTLALAIVVSPPKEPIAPSPEKKNAHHATVVILQLTTIPAQPRNVLVKMVSPCKMALVTTPHIGDVSRAMLVMNWSTTLSSITPTYPMSLFVRHFPNVLPTKCQSMTFLPTLNIVSTMSVYVQMAKHLTTVPNINLTNVLLVTQDLLLVAKTVSHVNGLVMNVRKFLIFVLVHLVRQLEETLVILTVRSSVPAVIARASNYQIIWKHVCQRYVNAKMVSQLLTVPVLTKIISVVLPVMTDMN